MTAQRHNRLPRQRPPAGERRQRAVYGIMTLDVDRQGIPIPGAAPVVGYIGQSRQTVWQREQQHRDEQPFADIIVGGSWTIEEGFWTQQELDERERRHIRNGVVLLPGQKPQRPKYNIDFNRENPDRIKPWEAVAHRQAREPGWQPPVKGARVSRQRRTALAASSPTAVTAWAWEWTPERIKAAVWAVAVLAVIGWVASLPVATWYDGVAYVACVACTVTGLRMPGKRRRRSRR
ncbi:hypothetical protein AB0I89_23915 [Micromonospora sp. NPDC049801]|uniref:hypothetical protein n=1 Tax=unclassified Micromonospora TaxID=2617518 RepID=UPI0033C1151C